ncbi:TPA: peptidase T [candidate division WOR-3]|uniref:Peptidase T n=2 Tax=Bacteria candidate phyla TaxID=1783234 RepID=A0A348MID3_UNCW3|nr:peptidase T [candidate division WOR-3 bacterium]
MGDYCKRVLKEEFGLEIYEDDAALKIGSNQSNIIAKYRGNPRKKTLLFCAHLDTVKPGKDVNPIRENGKIFSDGKTILGSDDKSGIAPLFEALRIVKENELDVPDIEIVLTVAEEVGLKGAKNLDFSVLKAKEGYALDSEDIEGIFNRAPSQNFIDITVEGIESHAGMSPEKGISAIKVLSEAIANMHLGRIDSQTTANIGVIEGGVASNIVAKRCSAKGEVRSHDDERLRYYTEKIKEAVYNAVNKNRIILPDGSVKTANCKIEVEKAYSAMYVKEDEPVLQRAIDVYKNLKIPYRILTGGGGSDANIFNEHGIKTVIIGTGMKNVHTVDEYILEEDLVTVTNIILGIMTHDQ